MDRVDAHRSQTDKDRQVEDEKGAKRPADNGCYIHLRHGGRRVSSLEESMRSYLAVNPDLAP